MDPEEIQKLIRAQPFRPFRIHLLDGSSHEMKHPEMVMVGRRTITLGIPRREGDTIYRYTELISLSNIGRIERLEPQEADPGASPT